LRLCSEVPYSFVQNHVQEATETYWGPFYFVAANYAVWALMCAFSVIRFRSAPVVVAACVSLLCLAVSIGVSNWSLYTGLSYQPISTLAERIKGHKQPSMGADQRCYQFVIPGKDGGGVKIEFYYSGDTGNLVDCVMSRSNEDPLPGAWGGKAPESEYGRHYRFSADEQMYISGGLPNRAFYAHEADGGVRYYGCEAIWDLPLDSPSSSSMHLYVRESYQIEYPYAVLEFNNGYVFLFDVESRTMYFITKGVVAVAFMRTAENCDE